MAVIRRDFVRFQNQGLLFHPKHKIYFEPENPYAKTIRKNHVEIKSSIKEGSIAAIIFYIAA